MPIEDPTEVPATLTAWRGYKPPYKLPHDGEGLEVGLIRGVWTPLEPFFLSHRYTLFDGSGPYTYPLEAFDPSQLVGLHERRGLPARMVQRKPDEYHFCHPEARPHVSEFWTEVSPAWQASWLTELTPSVSRTSQSPIHVAARSPTGTDVIIRIVSKGNEGHEHLKILRYLEQHRQEAENHALPLLDTLHHEPSDSTFAVFPVAGIYTDLPYFHRVSEVLDMVRQVLEVRRSCLSWLRRSDSSRDHRALHICTHHS